MAIDTEFFREKTFFPIPALIQISDGETCFLFDAVKCDLKPLGEYLLQSQQLKIFHSGSQDYEVFDIYIDRQRLPNTVDTQLAAQFINMSHCMGLGNLISELLNIEIPKTETVSDWIKRPLTEKQIQYACEDVLYLHQIYDILEHRLKESGKLEYFLSECELQNQWKDSTITVFEKNVKNSDSLRFQAIFKALLNWREDMAIHKNLPRNWILKDGQLKKIAKSFQPEQWQQIQLLSDKQIENYGPIFENIHKKYQDLSPKPIQTSQRDKLDFEKCFGIVKSRCQRQAQRADVPFEILFNTRNLKNLVHNIIKHRRFEPLMGWRGELLNESLTQACQPFVDAP